MELNTIDNHSEKEQQSEHIARDTLLDSWMNGLRNMFGKRKKPPRYKNPDTEVASVPPTNLNELQNMRYETTRSESGLEQTSKSMFGGHLEDSVDEETGVAKFVLWCVRAIETTGEALKSEGIYTVFGDQTRVNVIEKQDEQHMPTCLADEDNVSALATALKVFFRQLKSPLLNFQKFNQAFQSKDALEEMRHLVNSLEIPQRKTVSFVFQHLSRTLKLQRFNNICLVELGVVFGPTLMRLSPNCQDMAGEMKQQNSIVEFLIKSCDAIFPDPRDRDDSLDSTASDDDSDDTVKGSPKVTVHSGPQTNSNQRDSSSDEGGFNDSAMKVGRLPELVSYPNNLVIASKPSIPVKTLKQIHIQSSEASITRSSPEDHHQPRVLSWTVKDSTTITQDRQSSVFGGISSVAKSKPAVPPKPESVVQERAGSSKKTRSTPIDSYIQRASSESEESDYSDSDDSQEDTLVARSVPTSL